MPCTRTIPRRSRPGRLSACLSCRSPSGPRARWTGDAPWPCGPVPADAAEASVWLGVAALVNALPELYPLKPDGSIRRLAVALRKDQARSPCTEAEERAENAGPGQCHVSTGPVPCQCRASADGHVCSLRCSEMGAGALANGRDRSRRSTCRPRGSSRRARTAASPASSRRSALPRPTPSLRCRSCR